MGAGTLLYALMWGTSFAFALSAYHMHIYYEKKVLPPSQGLRPIFFFENSNYVKFDQVFTKKC